MNNNNNLDIIRIDNSASPLIAPTSSDNISLSNAIAADIKQKEKRPSESKQLLDISNIVHSNNNSNNNSYNNSFHIIKEGYLQKKGQLLKGWKKRWFICDGRTLSYYTNNKEKKPNAVIPLDTCTVTDGGMSETWNSPRIYLTDSTSGITYCLSAEEYTIVSEWLIVLQNAVNKLKTQQNTIINHTDDITSFDNEEDRSHSPLKKFNINKTLHDNNSPTKNNKTCTTDLFSNHTLLINKNNNTKQKPSNLKLENELATTIETINKLLKNDIQDEKNKFYLIDMKDGVRRSICYDTNKIYAKGSTVINASPNTIAKILFDVSNIKEWNIHFPNEKIIHSYGPYTDLRYANGKQEIQFNKSMYLNIENNFLMIRFFLIIMVMAYLTSLDNLFLNILYSYPVQSILLLLIVIYLFVSDVKRLYYPRDILFLCHLKENTDGSIMIFKSSYTDPNINNNNKEFVRAIVSPSGFHIQPIEEEDTIINKSRSLITYIYSIDLKGYFKYINTYCSNQFLLDNIQNLVNIREYMNQFRDLVIDDNENNNSFKSGKNNLDMELSINDNTRKNEDQEKDDIQWHPSSYREGMERLPSGGLKLTDTATVKKQKGVLMEVLKSFGAAILEGKSAVSLSLPIRIFEPRSMLERIVDLWLFAPNYLTKAAAIKDDPIERFKFVITFAIAGLHHSVGQMKPFNPILGETYQTQLIDGSQVYCEHTSHHPPISNFEIISNNNSYHLWGYFIFGGSFKTNALSQTQTGPVHIDFYNDTMNSNANNINERITYSMPNMRNSGFLWGDRIVEIVGSMIFTDEKNNLECEIKFNFDEKKSMVGSMFGSNSNKIPSDYFRGTIIYKDSLKEICEVTGSWLENIKFNDKIYWTIDKDISSNIINRKKIKYILPSDCHNREDLVCLRNNELEEGQEWKLKLEKLQRADRSKRKDGRLPQHWANSIHLNEE